MKIFNQYRPILLLFFVWFMVGYNAASLFVYLVLPLSLIMLSGRRQYMEMLLGFVFILFLSDSRLESIQNFARDGKEIYIVMLALFLITKGKDFAPFNRFFIGFIPFFIVAIICIFNTPPENLNTSIEKTISYILLLVAVPNYVQRAYLDHGKGFFKALVSLCTAILLAGFVFKFINPYIVTREDRFQGLFGNPNGLGIFCLLFYFLLTVTLELYPTLFDKREKIIMYGAILLSIITSGSRGSLFGLIIFYVFAFVYKKSPFIGTGLAIIIGVGYSYISDNLINVINFFGLSDYFRTYTLEQGSGRFVAWEFSWKYIQESFWFGRGFEYTDYIFGIPANAEILHALGHLGNAHNSYITLWLDTGLVGLSVYVLAFTAVVLKAVGKTRLAVPIMFAAIFSSFFESWLSASLNPFTIILFITLTIISSDIIIPRKNKTGIPV